MLSAAKMYPIFTGDVSVIGLFTRVPQRRSIKPVYSYSQFSHMMETDIENK